jgi:EmrB/QacA subfamily drug resistance transporter
MAMLFRTFAPHERVRASRILVIPTAFAPALGPVLGGLMVTDLSWRWAFYVHVPIGIAGIVFGSLFVREQRHDDPGRFDVAGFVLAGVGLASLMYALSSGPARGWTSPPIVGCALLGLALLVMLVVVELRSDAPMIDLHVLGNRLFANTSTVVVLGTTAFLGSMFLVALFYQDGFGVSALQSGLSTFPEAVGVMAGAQVASRLYPRIGPRRLMTGGLLAMIASLVAISLVPFTASLWVMRLLMLLIGYTAAHVFVPGQAASFTTISHAQTGRASALFNAGRQLGGAMGVAVLSTVISAVGVVHGTGSDRAPNATAYHAAFLAAAGIATIALLFTMRISDAEAAPSMRRTEEPERTLASA